MTKKEFKQEFALRYLAEKANNLALIEAIREVAEDAYYMAELSVEKLEFDSENTFFDDSEPEPEVELNEGGYPTNTPIMEVKELYTRTKHALLGGGVNTVAELLPLSRRDLLKFRNFGGRCLTNVNDFLEKYGFQLKTRAW